MYGFWCLMWPLVHITFELSGPKGRSLFGPGGGPQARNVLERFVMPALPK